MKRDMLAEVVKLPLGTERLAPDDSSTGRDASLALVIERAASGDSTAFEQLMIYTQHRVTALTWRVLGNEEDARDATQEVFLRVYKYLGRFKQEQDFLGWIYRITVNVCHDMERRRRISPYKLTSLEAEGQLEDSSDNQEDEVYLEQRREMMKMAMAALPEKERMSLVLRDFEGLSTEEVASIMNTRPATVRVQISSARMKIKRYCDRLLKRGQKEGGHGLH